MEKELPGLEADLRDYRAEIEKTGDQLAAARRRVELTTDKLRTVVVAAVKKGMSQSEAARLAGVRRQTVQEWMGK